MKISYRFPANFEISTKTGFGHFFAGYLFAPWMVFISFVWVLRGRWVKLHIEF